MRLPGAISMTRKLTTRFFFVLQRVCVRLSVLALLLHFAAWKLVTDIRDSAWAYMTYVIQTDLVQNIITGAHSIVTPVLVNFFGTAVMTDLDQVAPSLFSFFRETAIVAIFFVAMQAAVAWIERLRDSHAIFVLTLVKALAVLALYLAVIIVGVALFATIAYPLGRTISPTQGFDGGMVSLLVVGGFIFAVVLLVLSAWFVAIPAVLVDGSRNVRDSLDESRRLTAGGGRGFFVFFLILLVLSAFLFIILRRVGAGLPGIVAATVVATGSIACYCTLKNEAQERS